MTFRVLDEKIELSDGCEMLLLESGNKRFQVDYGSDHTAQKVLYRCGNFRSREV